MNAEGVKDRWSEPHIIGIIQFILNSEVSSETGITPFEYTFGSLDASYFKLPDATLTQHQGYLAALNADIVKVREEARRVQSLEQQKRQTGEILNTYAMGDYVLFDEASKGFRDQKLRPRYSGPYIVTSVNKADISCTHIVTAKKKVFHMEDLKPFIGSAQEAYNAAKCDDDQYVIVKILDYLGDPEKRSSMKFLILFEDGDKLWLEYNPDLAAATPFIEYCNTLPELEPLRMTDKLWRDQRSRYNSKGVLGVEPGDKCYVNLKSWGSDYYEALGLPMEHTYLVECFYTKWTSSRRKKIDLHCPIFGQRFDWDATAVRLYGQLSELPPHAVLVDQSLVECYPAIAG